MDVKLLRIDSRLVHGQVANNWAGSLGAEAILAVSDGAANDELRKTLMLQTGGGKVKVHVLGVEKAARVYKNPKYETLKAVIVVETPADIVRLLDLGVEAKEVNVGGMTFKQGTSRCPPPRAPTSWGPSRRRACSKGAAFVPTPPSHTSIPSPFGGGLSRSVLSTLT